LKLLLVRHGDPDYERDSLTEKGWREAEYLAERLADLPVRQFYVSPLGRARDTASCTLKRAGRTAIECPWLREFTAPIQRPDSPEGKTVTWDWLPQDWMGEEKFFRLDQWAQHPILQAGNVEAEYDWVVEHFDHLLEEHGYRRNGAYYQSVRPNNDRLVFFCHFGVECVLLSHLLNISPMVLWHGTCAAPTSVTTVVTEERRRGVVSFRMSAFGDTSHLYHHGEPPAFAARFCECYGNPGERVD
jgi:probable phosphoglycerate mutase